MNITLINARENDSQIAPFGLMYIAAVLEKGGHNVEIFDPLPGDLSFVDKISNTDIIGITFLTTEYLRAKKIASIVKPKSKYLVVGGVHITALPEIVKDLNADFGIIGEGEYTMKELVDKLEKRKSIKKIKGLVWRNKDKLIVNPRRELIQNLDKLPFPARHILDYGWYLRDPGAIKGYHLESCDRVLTSRGCPYNCLYCGSCNIFGRKTRRRSVQNVIEEIKLLKEKYYIDGLWFSDDNFILNEKWILDFCMEMKKLNLIWGCYSRVDRVKENLLVKMKDAGCVELVFGIESGSDKVLKAIRKGISTQQQLKAFQIAKKVGLKTFATILIGNPEETKQDIELTKKQLSKLKPDFVFFFFTTPFPGSDLYELALRNNWIKDKNFSKNWDTRRSEKPVMEAKLSSKELVKIRSQFQNAYFYKNHIDYLKRPGLVLKILYSFFTNPRSVIKATKIFIKTKRIDRFPQEAINSYRMRYNKEI